MVDFFFYLSLSIAVVAWGTSYALLLGWLWISLPIITGLIWLLGWLRNNRSVASPLLTLFAIGNAFGALNGGPVFLSLASLMAALAAWDLYYFNQRLGKQKGSESTRLLERNHILRVLVVCAITCLIASLATVVHLRLSLALAIALAVAATFGLNRMIKNLRKNTD